jgi:DNA-binding NarL/FixJ family response regulator
LRQLEPRRPDVISVDLGLPPEPERTIIGLRLLRELRSKFTLVPLAVHSGLQVEPGVLHELARIPASYIRIHDTDGVEAFAQMLPFIAQGFVIYSPSVAALLPTAIVVKPDPLDPKHWEVLELLSKGYTYERAADKLSVTVGAIQARVSRMMELLEERGFVEPGEEAEQRNLKDTLVKYYDEYHVRFGHGHSTSGRER